MNPRIAVALPVLPALAHAATLRWAAADLEPDNTFGGWHEVIRSSPSAAPAGRNPS